MLFNINGRGYREIKYGIDKIKWDSKDGQKIMESIRIGVKLMPSENNEGNLMKLKWVNEP
jgi:hypothetical protein